MRIEVVDCGVGNLASVMKALAFVGAPASRTSVPGSLAGAEAIVIPGVGHFSAMRALDDPLRRALGDAISRGVPVLGICLGMQWLFDGSTESTDVRGLGAMAGMCEALHGDVKVPHVGWNSLGRSGKESRLLAGIADGALVYFTHSYAAPVTATTVATTTHGREFASVVEHGQVFGVQWHPEKSGAVGLAVLDNFASIARASSC